MDTKKHRKKTTQNATLSMDIESHETDGLLKKRAPKRQGLAFKLAILLCGLGLLRTSGTGPLPAQP